MKSYLSLLKKLIKTPSFSKSESETATIIANFLTENRVKWQRIENNIWATNLFFDENLPTILLNSHHDTVRPVEGWTRDPHAPTHTREGKIYGLGSNDAGGCLVALIQTFLNFYAKKDLKFNIMLAATAEEEISGANGIELLLKNLPPPVYPSFGIVGEPTQLQMAVAEKGLMVVDGTAHGKAGHAARSEGENAIYRALRDIEKIQNFEFSHISPLLGAVKMTVTQIEAGRQHNVVPDRCHFVIDIRTNELYDNQTIFEVLKAELESELTPRSFRLGSSRIDSAHILVRAGAALGLSSYGSPTLSDQALMNFPTLKIGPGDSARSHTADEFIFDYEIENGIKIYNQILEQILF